MLEILAPTREFDDLISHRTSVFLGGGISNCPNWQSEMAKLLSDTKLVLLNPRREAFDLMDPTASEIQIVWEHTYLKLSTGILFWFPEETLCPITLYELGFWLGKGGKPIFIGCHPNYKRKFDVEFQAKLVRPELKVVDTLVALAEQVRVYDWPTPS